MFQKGDPSGDTGLLFQPSLSFVSPRLLHVEEEADGSAPTLRPLSRDARLSSLVNTPTSLFTLFSDPPLPEWRRGIQLWSAVLDKKGGAVSELASAATSLLL